jgi:hypothetical protein
MSAISNSTLLPTPSEFAPLGAEFASAVSAVHEEPGNTIGAVNAPSQGLTTSTIVS